MAKCLYTLRIALTLCLISTSSFALAKGEVEGIFNSKLNSVKEKYKKGMREISYCPDNTCSILEFRNTTSSEANTLFSFFVFYFSDYIYLEDLRKDPAVEKKILEHLNGFPAGDCKSQKVSKEKAFCILKARYEKKDLVIKFSRADEGVENVELDDALFKKDKKSP